MWSNLFIIHLGNINEVSQAFIVSWSWKYNYLYSHWLFSINEWKRIFSRRTPQMQTYCRFLLILFTYSNRNLQITEYFEYIAKGWVQLNTYTSTLYKFCSSPFNSLYHSELFRSIHNCLLNEWKTSTLYVILMFPLEIILDKSKRLFNQ